MIKFSLPGFHEFFKLNNRILDLKSSNEEIFYPNICIDNIYGSIPGVVWNGGRNSPFFNIDIQEVERIFKIYSEKNVRLRLTFTNSRLEEKHLEDLYSNKVLELVAKYHFEITISSPLLEGYIRTSYPDIPLISSTTKCILGINELNEELNKDYIVVVLDFRKNNDFEFLNKIKKINKIEVLLNEDCYCGCTQRKRHYDDISMNILMEDKMPDTEYYCPGKCSDLYESLKQATTISNRDVFDIYQKMGITKVKLRGRRSDFFDVLESYLYYMIKDEYRDGIRLKLLKENLVENYYK